MQKINVNKRAKFLYSLGYKERTVNKYNGEFLLAVNERKPGEFLCWYHRPRFIKGYRCIMPNIPTRASPEFIKQCGDCSAEKIMSETVKYLSDNGERIERRRFPNFFFFEIIGDNIHLIFKVSFKKDICNMKYLYFDKE